LAFLSDHSTSMFSKVFCLATSSGDIAFFGKESFLWH
jgi:hypothetical protein